MAPRQRVPRRARRGAYRSRARRVRAPIGAGERRELVRNRLIESRLTPNAISLTGLALNVVAAVLVWEGLMFLGGIAFIVGSIMDTLDGRYSRMSGKGTPFGAFLDSTLDRAEEGIVLAAVAGYFALQGDRVAAAAVVIAVMASLMVSYTRARAEGLGVSTRGDAMLGTERIVLLAAGSWIAAWFDDDAVLIVGATMALYGVAAAITALHRGFVAYARLRETQSSK